MLKETLQNIVLKDQWQVFEALREGCQRTGLSSSFSPGKLQLTLRSIHQISHPHVKTWIFILYTLFLGQLRDSGFGVQEIRY